MSKLKGSSHLLAHILSCRTTSAAHASLRTVLPLQSRIDFKVLSIGTNMSFKPDKRAHLIMKQKANEFHNLTHALLQERIDAKLHDINIFVKKTGRVPEKGIRDLLELMKKNGSCTSNQAVFALRCCGSILADMPIVERQVLTEQLWNFILESKVKLATSHFNTLLKVCIDNEQDFLPTDILAMMDEHQAVPNQDTFQHLIAKYCQV